MVQIDYKINQNLPDSVKQEIAAQPNLINVESNGTSSLFSFDHTPAQAITFKKFLNTKIGLNNDALSKYTNKSGGALVYTTDTAVTLTNIGSTFKNLFTRSDGLSFGFDTDVYDQIRLIVHWTRVGTGVSTVQVVDKNTPTNVIASIDIQASGGSSPFVGQWVDIPDIFKNTVGLYLLQVKSTVAADDPVFEGIRIYAK